MISIGVDIADLTFTASASNAEYEALFYGQTFEQNSEGYDAFLALILSYAPIGELCVTMEATGVYSERLSHFLYAQHITVFVEPPLSVKKGMYERDKNDPVDSRQIAEYYFRFKNKLHPWQPPAEIIDQLKTMLTAREQFTKILTACKNSRKTLCRKQYQHIKTIEYYALMITRAEDWIESLEKDMGLVCQTNAQLFQTLQNVKNIKNVGILIALNIAVITDGFTRHVKYQSISKYIGIYPKTYQSGTSIHRRPSSDGAGPARLRKLLYLAAMRLKKSNPDFQQYYERKLAEGKAPQVILNNMANKVLKIICGVIRSGKPYMREYHSIKP